MSNEVVFAVVPYVGLVVLGVICVEALHCTFRSVMKRRAARKKPEALPGAPGLHGTVGPEQRGVLLKSLAGAMRFRAGREIEEASMEVNSMCCRPPMEASEVRAIAHAEGSTAEVPQAQSFDDDPLVDALQRFLEKRTGYLRVADAYLICGLDPGKVNQDQITRFSRAIRALGWERQRRRVDESLQYTYAKGTPEREVELIVEYDPIAQMTVLTKCELEVVS